MGTLCWEPRDLSWNKTCQCCLEVKLGHRDAEACLFDEGPWSAPDGSEVLGVRLSSCIAARQA